MTIRATIGPFPWGTYEGMPVLRISGICDSPAEADACVAELEAKLARYCLLGTVVELDEFASRGAAALLVGLNASERLRPTFVLGSPGMPLPSAGAPSVMLDVSQYFQTAPLDVAKWADDVLAVAQVSPRVEQIKITTAIPPQMEQLAQVFAAFRPEVGATIYVPRDIYAQTMLSAAACGFPWMVRLRTPGEPAAVEVRR